MRTARSSCRRLRSASAFAVAISAVASVASAQPATDINLGELVFRDGTPAIAALRNITERDGYDNQPQFTPDGASILYTSIRDGQADTYRYSIAAETTERVTRTSESEYSPTVMPAGDAFSVIQVEADSTQRLWHFDFDGNVLGVLLRDAMPVGYHAWGDQHTVALFVLGDPPTLQLADIRTGEASVVESSIGRSLHKIPGRAAISFVHQITEEEWWIKALDLRSGEVATLVRTLAGSQDYAWTPSGMVLMGKGSLLYYWNPETEAGWEQVTDLASFGIEEISRIAVSSAGDQIALVSSRPE